MKEMNIFSLSEILNRSCADCSVISTVVKMTLETAKKYLVRHLSWEKRPIRE